MCGLHRRMVSPPRAGVTLKKIDSPSPKHYQLPVVPKAGVWDLTSTSPLRAEILPGLSQHWSCACCLNCSEFLCAAVPCLESTVSCHPYADSYSLPIPSSTMSPEPLLHRYRAEPSTVSYALCLDELRVFCVNYHLLGKACLTKVDGYTSL